MSEASADLPNKTTDQNPSPKEGQKQPIIFGIEFFMKPNESERERDIRIPPGPNVANPFFPGEAYRSRMDITRLSSGMQMTIADNGVQGMPNMIPGQLMLIDTSKKLVKNRNNPSEFTDGPIIVTDGLSLNANATVLEHLSSSWKDTFGNEIKVLPNKIYNFDESKIKTMVYFALRCIESKLAVVIPQVNGGKVPTRDQIDDLPGTYLLGRGKMSGHRKIQDAENAAQSLQM